MCYDNMVFELCFQARLALARESDRYRHIERTRPISQVITMIPMLWLLQSFTMLCFFHDVEHVFIVTGWGYQFRQIQGDELEEVAAVMEPLYSARSGQLFIENSTVGAVQ